MNGNGSGALQVPAPPGEWWAGDDGSLLPHDSFGALLLSARDKWLAKAEAEAEAEAEA
ncbi:hypothetical protein ACFXPA_24385 [Amycolatopsis sp. NPDC059090]|uniref:hypothetical protein n=1 Tax=Amycolatopsis sp. NPDC059090 TaxID=3346723 RepID=UPI00367361B8